MFEAKGASGASKAVPGLQTLRSWLCRVCVSRGYDPPLVSLDSPV